MPCGENKNATLARHRAGQKFDQHWYTFLKLGLVFLVYAWGAGAATAAKTGVDIAGLCDQAAIEASRSKGVPLDVLRAISRTETGRAGKNGLQPWPWTVNMEGTGRWFATLDEARAFVFLNFKRGARSFDVGCFQINYKWHGGAFRSIDDMFDPVLNAQYAAAFLAELYQEFGNWPDAIGAYHSRTPALAEKYTARFDRIRASLSGAPAKDPSGRKVGWPPPESAGLAPGPDVGPRPLFANGTVALGSLVPILRQPGGGSRPFVLLN